MQNFASNLLFENISASKRINLVSRCSFIVPYLFIIVAVVCAPTTFLSAQANGDFRSAASGDWFSPSKWEFYNGTSWVANSPLVDGDFSSGWTNVQVSGSNAFTVGPNNGKNGTGDAGVSISGTAGAWYYKQVSLVAGITYSVNFDYVASTTDALNKRIAVAIHSSPPASSNVINNGYTGATYFFNSLVTSTSWVTRGYGQAAYLSDFTPPTTGTYYIAIGVNQTTATNIKLDNIILSAFPTSNSGSISILNGHTVELNNDITIDQTTINQGGALELKAGTITLNNGAGTDLQINGTYRRSASTTVSIQPSATIVVGNGSNNGVYEHNFAGGSIPQATWNTGSVLMILNSIDAGAGNPSGLDQTFYNVVVTGGISYMNRSSGDKTMTVNNELRIEGGEFWMQRNSFASGTQTLEVKGNFYQTGGVFGWNFVQDNTHLKVRVYKDLIIDGGSWSGFQTSLTATETGVYFMGNGIEQTYRTVLTHASGAQRNRFYYKTTSGPIGLNEIYKGTSEQYTINGTGWADNAAPADTYGTPEAGYAAWPTSGTLLKSFTINNAAGVKLRNNRTINDTLYRTIGSITACTTVGAPCALPTPGSTPLIAYAAGTTLEYNGSSAITTEDMEFPTTNGPTNLNVNNPGSVTLHADRTLPGTGKLIFSVDNGLLNTGTCNSTTSNVKIILSDGTTVTGAGTRRFINGICRKIGDDAFTFPVGRLDIADATQYKYAPVTITAPALATDHFTTCYLSDDPSGAGYNRSSKDASMTTPTNYDVSSCEFWHINRTNGSSDVSVTLSWAYGRSCFFSNASDLVVTRWTGSLWTNHYNNGSNTAGPPVTSGTVTSQNAITSFSPFTLAHPLMRTWILAQNILTFTGQPVKGAHLLQWKTEKATNESSFTLERSADGLRFETLALVEATAGALSTNTFQYFDHTPLSGTNYYRLKQYNRDKQPVYSNVVMLRNQTNRFLVVYPNPFTDQILIKGSGQNIRSITVMNATGQLLYHNTSSFSLQETISTRAWSKGHYHITVWYQDGSRESMNLIK